MTEKLEPQEILSLPLGYDNRSDAATVGQYLVRLAQKAAVDRDADYPFGNSDWETPLLWSFANADLMWIRTDENSLIDDYSSADLDKILNSLYEFLFQVDYSTMDTIKPPPPPKEWYLVCVDRDSTRKGQLTDYFSEPHTEEEAQTLAIEHNKPFSYHAWSAVRIPPVS